TRLDAFDGAFGDRRPRGVRLHAPVVAALTPPSIGVDADMSELGRRVGGPAIDVAIDDDPAADAGPERETDDVVRAARRSAPPLPVDRAVRVVVERCRQAEAFAHAVAQRHVGPAEIGRQQDDAGLGVERTRRADADAFDFLSRFLDRRLGKLDDPADHRIGALCCEGRLRHDAMNLGAVLSNDSGYEIRSSDVNSDDVAHPYPRWLEPLPQQ